MSTIICKDISIKFEDYPVKLKYSSNSSLQIFQINIPEYYNLVTWLYNYLDEDEKKRANRFHFEKDTNSFIICRSLLKLILAHRTNQDISDIIIHVEKNGKPILLNSKGVFFNLSHSDKYAILAVDQKPVGIDIEYINPNFDYTEVLHHSFNKSEQNEIKSKNNFAKEFYKFWTRKEAIVKMTGKGIDERLSQLQVINGKNTVESSFLAGLNNLLVLSFEMNQNYIVSISTRNVNLFDQKLKIYETPASLPVLKKLTMKNHH